MRIEEKGVRTVLHSDLNNFYASVETLRHPEFRDKPLAVFGSIEDRHGIVLAKNGLAKACGIRTGDVYWQAKKKCSDLTEVQADFSAYYAVSEQIFAVYERYTDKIEPFGIDECWLDVSDCVKYFGSGREIAERISAEIKRKFSLTVSIGVSWNKIFAKLGSDLKKPDAITEITQDNYKTLIWKLPAENLLFVGKATKEKLNKYNIFTIGDLAVADENFLCEKLGKWGVYLRRYANGKDDAPVAQKSGEKIVKSVGNSLTSYRDLVNFDEVKPLLVLLCESVASRLRQGGYGKAHTVKVTATDNLLLTHGKQDRFPVPVRNAKEICERACALFSSFYDWSAPVRAVGVSVSDFTKDGGLFDYSPQEIKNEKLEEAVDKLKEKYGSKCLQRAEILKDKRFFDMDVTGGHLVFSDDNKDNRS